MDNYDKVITQGFGIIEVLNMAFVNGVEISGDYDGFFHLFMGKGCEVLGKGFLDLRLIRLYELLLNFIIFNKEF